MEFTNVVILGAPAFSRPAWPYEGKWIDMAAIRERIAGTKPERILMDFSEPDSVAWVPWVRARATSVLPEAS